MTRLLSALAFTGLLLVVHPDLVAEDLTTADYMEFVKPFLGVWKFTTESDGKVTEATWWARLSPTNTCGITYAEGQGLPATQTIDGYDPVAKKWTVAAYDTEGNFSLSRMSFNGKKGQQYGKGVTSSGETVTYKKGGTTADEKSDAVCLECTENRIAYALSNVKKDGESQPDVTITMDRESATLRPSRQPALPATTEGITVADYIEFWRPLFGSWKTSTEVDGKAVPGTWRARLSATNTCVVTYGEGGGFATTQTIDGYDPVAKKWTVVGFDADGSFLVATTEFVDMKKGKRLAPGAIGHGEDRVFRTDGTTKTITSELSCVECTDNRVVLVWTDRKEDGQAASDLKWVCERQRRSERRVRQ